MDSKGALTIFDTHGKNCTLNVNLKDNVPSFEKINLNKKSPVNKGISFVFDNRKT